MLSILGGFEENGIKFLEGEDAMAQQWNKHTLGIDYFPCFTLKHQMRKYFFFGDALDAEYLARMKKAAKIFTEKDPLGRRHHAYTGKGVWGPDGKNSWVDVRSTDNLKLMRDTSVYLLAEETGNEKTRQRYKQHLTEFVVTMYHTGMGEWDSENYLGHSIAPMLNLYDFAKDPEVKALAKAGLDWMATCAALKYWRGSFCGPTRRDYNHPYAFGGSAAALTWLWFGDAPLNPEHFESDEIHLITSAYRPPAAVVHLAHKSFTRPLELIAGKPEWAAWQDPDLSRPVYRETQFFGKTFQFGTLVRGTQDPDINGFKILVYSKKRGADTLMAAPIHDPRKLGSPQYESGVLARHSAVGQNGNVAVYLTKQSDHPYLWLLPAEAEVRKTGNATFIECEKNTIAVWPINLSHPTTDADLTDRVQYKLKKPNKKSGKTEKAPLWPGSKVLKANRQNNGLYGFAIEIDEGRSEDFVKKAAKLAPETNELSTRSEVTMTAVSGRRVKLQWSDYIDNIRIWRNGELRDWDSPDENVAFRTLDGKLVHQPWQGNGTLRVTAGGRKFSCTVDRKGKAVFSEK
jgi:hypothetical protein